MKPTKTLRVNFKACTGCRSCTIACVLHHAHQIGLHRAHIRVEKTLPDIQIPAFKPIFCRMCRNAKCIAVCPTGALTEDKETGWVQLNAALCNGCGECVQACPFDAIWLDEHQHVAVKCDLCGGDPTCVRYCAPGALIFQ